MMKTYGCVQPIGSSQFVKNYRMNAKYANLEENSLPLTAALQPWRPAGTLPPPPAEYLPFSLPNVHLFNKFKPAMKAYIASRIYGPGDMQRMSDVANLDMLLNADAELARDPPPPGLEGEAGVPGSRPIVVPAPRVACDRCDKPNPNPVKPPGPSANPGSPGPSMRLNPAVHGWMNETCWADAVNTCWINSVPENYDVPPAKKKQKTDEAVPTAGWADGIWQQLTGKYRNWAVGGTVAGAVGQVAQQVVNLALAPKAF